MNTNQDINEFKYQIFSEINLSDHFFDSLKEDYLEFERWFNKKVDIREKALVHYNNNLIDGFLYLKEEDNFLLDIVFTSRQIENLIKSNQRCLKIGTLKIDAHGMKLGEQFIKKFLIMQ